MCFLAMLNIILPLFSNFPPLLGSLAPCSSCRKRQRNSASRVTARTSIRRHILRNLGSSPRKRSPRRIDLKVVLHWKCPLVLCPSVRHLVSSSSSSSEPVLPLIQSREREGREKEAWRLRLGFLFLFLFFFFSKTLDPMFICSWTTFLSWVVFLVFDVFKLLKLGGGKKISSPPLLILGTALKPSLYLLQSGQDYMSDPTAWTILRIIRVD